MFQSLSAAIAQVEQLLLDRELSALDRAEGEAYVAGLVRVALDRAMTSSDPNWPRFYYTKDPVSRWGTGNPDNVNRSVDIHGDAQYLVTGERGTTAEIVVETLSVVVGDHATDWGEGIASLDSSTLQVDEAGRYQIVVGGEPPKDGGNYLPTGPKATAVFVRHVFGRDDEQAGSIGIRRLTPPTAPPRPAAELVELAAARLVANAIFHEDLALKWRTELPVNAAGPIRAMRGPGHLPGQHNAKGRFELEPDEALIVSVDEVECRYGGLAISHDLWSYVFDYELNLNQARAYRSSDGRIHYVISGADPGVPNWCPTLGHANGIMIFRWTGVTGTPPSNPEFRRVDVSKVRDCLPADDPTVSPTERAEIKATRYELLSRRFYGRC